MRPFLVRSVLIAAAFAAALGAFIVKDRVSTSTPVGIVVPHHDMVASTRQAYLERVGESTSPATIVLLSPDHFATNRTPFVASTRTWQLSVGELEPDLALIARLGLVTDEADFKREHGITGLLRDIKIYFPSSRIVPVMISQSAPYEDVESFVRSLYQECPDCLLISSVDFSHTVEANVAHLHDTLTLRELSEADPLGLYTQAEVDSPQSLAALALWGQLHGATGFELFSHTNSGYITGRPVGEMTTHIIGGYSQTHAAADDSVTLLIVSEPGTVDQATMTDSIDLVRQIEADYGDRLLWGSDVAVVTLGKQQSLYSRSGESVASSYPVLSTVDEGMTKVVLLTADPDNPTALTTAIRSYHDDGYTVIVIEHADNVGSEWSQHMSDWVAAGAGLIVSNRENCQSPVTVSAGRPVVCSLEAFTNQSSGAGAGVLGAVVDDSGTRLFIASLATTSTGSVIQGSQALPLEEWSSFRAEDEEGNWFYFSR